MQDEGYPLAVQYVVDLSIYYSINVLTRLLAGVLTHIIRYNL